MDKTMSWRKVGAFCGLFFAKERRKALKGKPDSILQVDFSSVIQTGAARDVPTVTFYGHINVW